MAPKREGTIWQISHRHAKILLCLLVILIAAVDLSLPANINIATLYFVVIVLAGWTRSTKWLWGFTVICILLTFGGLTLAPAPTVNLVTWIDWLNRSMTAVALAVAAIPVHLRLRNIAKLERNIAERERAERALQESHNLLEKRVDERTAALAMVVDELQKENASRIQVEGELRESERSLRELSVELLNAQDEERRHIGQELHDGLGQCLAGLKLSLHFVDQAMPAADDAARKHFAECCELTDDAIAQVRTLSHLMYPPVLEQMGLESAIPWYVRGFEQRSGVQTELEMPERLERLPQQLELTVFRILQESLTNIHRHSGSPTAEVRFEIKDGTIVLQVKDSGKGIINQPNGVGLRSMRERAKQLKGTLEISSGPQGTTLTASLPIGGKSDRLLAREHDSAITPKSATETRCQSSSHSEEHHHVLEEASKIRRAAESNAPDRDQRLRHLAESLIGFWEESGQRHFTEEEQVLLPKYARRFRLDEDPDIMHMLADHARIRAQMVDLKKSLSQNCFVSERLIELVRLFYDHVLLEEQRILPRIEGALNDEGERVPSL